MLHHRPDQHLLLKEQRLRYLCCSLAFVIAPSHHLQAYLCAARCLTPLHLAFCQLRYRCSTQVSLVTALSCIPIVLHNKRCVLCMSNAIFIYETCSFHNGYSRYLNNSRSSCFLSHSVQRANQRSRRPQPGGRPPARLVASLSIVASLAAFTASSRAVE